MARETQILFAEAARLASAFHLTEPDLHCLAMQYQECLAALMEDLQEEGVAAEAVLHRLVEKAEPASTI